MTIVLLVIIVALLAIVGLLLFRDRAKQPAPKTNVGADDVDPAHADGPAASVPTNPETNLREPIAVSLEAPRRVRVTHPLDEDVGMQLEVLDRPESALFA